jgi:uncharacterized phage protein (TIGR01671 family)
MPRLCEQINGGGIRMREIKFRGKYKGTGKWIYGSLVQAPNDTLHSAYISVDEFAYHDEGYGYGNLGEMRVYSRYFPVDPATVGQYTGLKDKNGAEIYEGDIVRHESFGVKKIMWGNSIDCLQGCCGFMYANTIAYVHQRDSSEIEKVGNIHDNP